MDEPPVGLNRVLIEEAYTSEEKTPDAPMPNDERYNTTFYWLGTDTLSTKCIKARSWLFLEAFERFFGRYSKVNDATDVALLHQEIQYVESLPAAQQFISPIEYQVKIFGRGPAKRLSKKPYPGLPADPRSRFVYHLRLTMPGWYWWHEGRSDAFGSWLQDGAVRGFGPSSKINCWEMVFFAAIKAGFMNAEDLKAAYNLKLDSGKVLSNRFEKKMVLYDANGKPPTLNAGDIIMHDEWHHVFAVVERDKPIDELKIVQLWGNGGAGVTFYGNMGGFLGWTRSGRTTSAYYVIKLDS